MCTDEICPICNGSGVIYLSSEELIYDDRDPLFSGTYEIACECVSTSEKKD